MSNFLAEYLVDWATLLPSEEKLRDVIANASRLTTGLVAPHILAPNPSPTKVLFGNNTWGDVTLTIPEDVVREADLAAIALSGSANDLISGTIPLLRFPVEVARRDQSNSFIQDQNMSLGLNVGGLAFQRGVRINSNISNRGRVEFVETNGLIYGYIGLSSNGLDIESLFSNRVNINNPLVVTDSTTASSFIRSGGTSAQFLKADGSVDSNSYYLSSNPSNFISRTGISGGTGINYNSSTGVIASTITQYTDSLARMAISLTTTGSSGAATYNSSTGVLNIPNYAGGVTSVNTQTGAVVLTTSHITEGTNLYYTDVRSRASLSFASGTGSYNSTTGVITIPTNTTHLTNGAGFITENQNIIISGDATGTGTTSIALTLANSGVAAGTYNNSSTQVRPFTVDAKGRITSIGTAVNITPAWSSITGAPTTLSGYGITDAVPSSRTITINGTSQDLSSNRTFNVGTVTGTGTTNYLSKFTDTTVLGNSQIFDNGTNVGIGTTTLPNKFVVSSASSGTTLQATFTNTTSGQPVGFRLNNGLWDIGFRTNPGVAWFEITDSGGGVQHRWDNKNYMLASDGRLMFSSQSDFATNGTGAQDVSIGRASAGVLRVFNSAGADGSIQAANGTFSGNVTGTWTGNTVGILYGGTGATTAQGARTNLLPSQTGNSGRILGTNGTDVSWVTAGSGGIGDVVGPATATDNAFVRFNGTTGKLIQDSNASLDDLGNATFEGLTVNGEIYSTGNAMINELKIYDPIETWYGTIKINNNEIIFLNANGSPITSTLGLTDLSRVGHVHSASDITSGTLIKARQHAQTAYLDQANTFTQPQVILNDLTVSGLAEVMGTLIGSGGIVFAGNSEFTVGASNNIWLKTGSTTRATINSSGATFNGNGLFVGSLDLINPSIGSNQWWGFDTSPGTTTSDAITLNSRNTGANFIFRRSGQFAAASFRTGDGPMIKSRSDMLGMELRNGIDTLWSNLEAGSATFNGEVYAPAVAASIFRTTSSRWWQYENTGDPNFYLRDMVNSRMQAVYVSGANSNIAATLLYSTLNVEGLATFNALAANGQATLNAGLQVNGAGVISGNIVSVKSGADASAHIRLVRIGWQGWGINQAYASLEFTEDGALSPNFSLISGGGASFRGFLNGGDGLFVNANTPSQYFFDGNVSYHHIPGAMIRKDSAATVAADTLATLVLYNRNGGNNTGSKLAFVSNETSSTSSNPVTTAAIVSQKVSGVDTGWATGNLKFLLKSGSNYVEALTLTSTASTFYTTSAFGNGSLIGASGEDNQLNRVTYFATNAGVAWARINIENGVQVGWPGVHGQVSLNPGDANNSGYVAWYKTNGIRSFYMGYNLNTGNDLSINADLGGSLRVAPNLIAQSNVQINGTINVDGKSSFLEDATFARDLIVRKNMVSNLGAQLYLGDANFVGVYEKSSPGLAAVQNASQGVTSDLGFYIYTGQLTRTEAMRIMAPGGNLVIGATTDNGAKLQVNGSATFNGNVTVTKSNPVITLQDQIDNLDTSIVFNGYSPRGSYRANGNFDHVISLNNQFNANPRLILRSITGTGGADLEVQGSAIFAGNKVALWQNNGYGLVSLTNNIDSFDILNIGNWAIRSNASLPIEMHVGGSKRFELSTTGATFTGTLRVTKPTDGLMVGFGANNSPDLLTFSYSNIVSGSSTIESSVWGPLVLSSQSNQNIVLDPHGTGKVHIGPRLAPAYAKLTVTGGDITTIDGNITVFKPSGPKLLLTTGENAGIDGAPKNIDIEFAGFYGANAIIRAQETSASNSRSPIIFYNHDVPGVMQERMRIARNTGNLLIGTSDDLGAKVEVAGGYLRVKSGAANPPGLGKGLELTFDEVSNIGYVLAYDRTNGWPYELRLGANGSLMVDSNGLVRITSGLYIPGSESHIHFQGDGNNYLGNTTFFRNSTGSVTGAWINGTTGISSAIEYRLSGNSYSRVAQIDAGGGWGGGYNFNLNSSTPQRDSTGAVCAIRFNQAQVELFAEASGSPGAISARYGFSSTGANFLSPLVVPDEAYSATWDGSMQVPTKNAIYDRIQALVGGISVAGSNTQIQYNNSGAFGASSNFTFNPSTNVLSVTGKVGIGISDPLAKLHVHGTANDSSIRLSGGLGFDGLKVDGLFAWGGGSSAATISPTFVSGSANSNIALVVSPIIGASTTGSIIGLNITNLTTTNSSTLNAYTALYINNPTLGVTNYSIYSEGGLNYFGGPITNNSSIAIIQSGTTLLRPNDPGTLALAGSVSGIQIQDRDASNNTHLSFLYSAGGSFRIHRNSLDQFTVNNSGSAGLQCNVWHESLGATPEQRFYFEADSTTYIKGHGAIPVTLRNGSDVDLVVIDNSGNATFNGRIDIQNNTISGRGLRLLNSNTTGYSDFFLAGSSAHGVTDWVNSTVIEGASPGGLALSGWTGGFRVQTGSGRITRFGIDATGVSTFTGEVTSTNPSGFSFSAENNVFIRMKDTSGTQRIMLGRSSDNITYLVGNALRFCYGDSGSNIGLNITSSGAATFANTISASSLQTTSTQTLVAIGSVVAGNSPGLAFIGKTNSGIGANSDNMGFWESGVLALNMTNALKEIRVPSDYTFAFSSATNNNASADTMFSRASANTLQVGAAASGNLLLTNLTASGSITNGLTKTHNLTRTLPSTVGNFVDIGSFSFFAGVGFLDIVIIVGISGNSQTKSYKIPCHYNSTLNNWRKYPAISSSGQYDGTQDFDLEFRQSNGIADIRIRKTLGTIGGSIYVSIVQHGRVDIDTFTPSTATGSGGAPTVITDEMFANNLTIRDMGGSTQNLLTLKNYTNSNIATISNVGHITTWGGASGNYIDLKDMSSNTHAYIFRENSSNDCIIGYRQFGSGVLRARAGITTTFKLDGSGNAEFLGTALAASPPAGSNNTLLATTSWTNNLFNNMGQGHATQSDFNSIGDFGFRFVQGASNGPGTGAPQFYCIALGLGIDYPYNNYALQFAIPRDIYGANDNYLSIRIREAGTWGSWKKIAAGTADGLREFTWATRPAASSTKGPIIITDTTPANSLWTSDGSVWRAQTRTRKVMTFSSTMTLDSSEAMVQRITLTNNLTLNKFTNGFDGASLEIVLRQDGTGGRTLTFGSGFRFNEYITSITLSTGANKTDRILFEYDSVSDVWDVISFVKGS